MRNFPAESSVEDFTGRAPIFSLVNLAKTLDDWRYSRAQKGGVSLKIKMMPP